MAEASDVWGILYQNLIDAGCNQETARQCMSLAKGKKADDLLRQLSHHRTKLLETVHLHQKKIDCLDFLIYKIKKDSGNYEL